MGSTEAYEADLNLKLGLPGTQDSSAPQSSSPVAAKCHKRALAGGDRIDARASSKAQVVGWPPIRSYRRSTLQSKDEEADAAGGIYVKVSMEGAPYLRKIDLRICDGYPHLLATLREMFNCFNLGDLSDGSEYVPTYEDKDGDWMLAGDVPWEMFVSSCKKLRIMKGSQARGLRSWV